MSNLTINVYQTPNGWTWHIPTYGNYKNIKRGPFKIAALAHKDCFFYLEDRKRIDEIASRSRSRWPRE